MSTNHLQLKRTIDEIWMTLLRQHEELAAAFNNEVGIGDAPAVLNIEREKTRLAVLLDLIREYALTEHPVTVSTTKRSACLELNLQFHPNPLFALIVKSIGTITERQPSLRTIQTLQDPGAAYLIAERIGSQNFIQTAMSFHREEGVTFHSYYLQRPVKRNGGRERPLVLVIEDTKPIGLLVEMYLRQSGCNTLLAHEGQTGVQLAREHKPDLITLDVMMPQKDGWQVLEELKTSDDTAMIPVVIVSVLKDKQVGYQFGASDYLTKPVVREELLECVNRITSSTTLSNRKLSTSNGEYALIANAERAADLSNRLTIFPSHLIQPGDTAFLERILNLPQLPDYIVADLAETKEKTLGSVHRIRLSNALNSLPIVGVIQPKQENEIDLLTNGLVDALILEETLSPEKVREKLALS